MMALMSLIDHAIATFKAGYIAYLMILSSLLYIPITKQPQHGQSAGVGRAELAKPASSLG